MRLRLLFVLFLSAFLLIPMFLNGATIVSVDLNNRILDTSFDFSKTEPYRLLKCHWYDKDDLLLVFEIPGINEKLLLISYNINTKNSKLLFNGAFSVEYDDTVLSGQNFLGYQNNERALIFNKYKKTILRTYKKSKGDQFISLSPNMKYIAKVREDGLYITDTNLSRKLDDTSKSYISLNWSNDSSKLIYITNNYSDICIIDINTGKKRILRGGKDFEYPKGIVSLLRCKFLPNNEDIVISVLCEDGEALSIIRSKESKSKIIQDENKDIIFMDMSDQLILYTEKQNTGKSKLICYDYLRDKTNEIVTTPSNIICSSFSPKGDKIAVATYFNGKHDLFVCQTE